MTYTFDEAREDLISNPGKYTTRESLLELSGKVSVEAKGSITMLYSGMIPDFRQADPYKNGLYTSDLVKKW